MMDDMRQDMHEHRLKFVASSNLPCSLAPRNTCVSNTYTITIQAIAIQAITIQAITTGHNYIDPPKKKKKNTCVSNNKCKVQSRETKKVTTADEKKNDRQETKKNLAGAGSPMARPHSAIFRDARLGTFRDGAAHGLSFSVSGGNIASRPSRGHDYIGP